MKRRLLAAAIGLLAGVVVPLPVARVADPSIPDPSGSSTTEAGAAEPAHCAPRAVLDEEIERLGQSREALAGARASFRIDWGEPIPPPEDWQPVEAEASLSARVDQLAPLASDVDCRHYPCLVALALDYEPDVEALARELDLDPSTIGFSTAEVNGRTIWMPGMAAIREAPSDEEHAKWLSRRLVAHQHFLRLDALVEEQGR